MQNKILRYKCTHRERRRRLPESRPAARETQCYVCAIVGIYMRQRDGLVPVASGVKYIPAHKPQRNFRHTSK